MEHESDTHFYWKSPSIQTYTGCEFFPLAPRAADIDPADVAHALGLKCRYTGHCLYFYSVAQHSVLMSRYLEARGADPVDQRWALMHDASEAYLPDVAGPIKKHLPGFCEVEDKVLMAVAERFDLPWPHSSLVKHADRVMYWREREVLMPDATWIQPPPPGLEITEDMRDDIPIERWDPDLAVHEFRVRFIELFDEGKRAHEAERRRAAERIREINRQWDRRP